MATLSLEELYDRYIRPLPPAERLQLLAMTAQDLAHQPDGVIEKPTRNIMELHGLGAEIWEAVDAQEHVNALREEWDHRL